QEADPGPELRDPRGDLVPDAHHVADAEAGNDVDVDAAHLAGGLPIEVAGLEIAVLDDVVAVAVLLAARGGHGLHLVDLVLQGRNGHREAIDAALAGA